MLTISFAGCLGLSPVLSTQFTPKMCVAASNREKKSLKTPILGVQGRSRSSMLVPPERSSAVLVMMSSKSASICNRSHARRANSGKIKFVRGYLSLMPLFEGNLLTQWHQITSLETMDPRLPYGENLESLSHLGLTRYRVMTSGQTDRQTENSHS